VRPVAFAVAVVAFAAAFFASGDPRAQTQSDAEKARRAEIVAHVGPRTITLGELEDRLATVPRFQLSTFGTTPDAIRRKFLDDVIVQEVLLSLGAEDRHLDKELPTSYQLERARSNATLRVVRAQIGPAASIPMDDVKRYYEENRARYDSPERINVWRVLCQTKEEAAQVLDKAKKDPSLGNFSSLARDHSLDKATYMRGGNLGFLGPDGASNEAGLKVDPAVVKAAQTVKDGELVPSPVQEGEYFAVAWRRGTVGASRRSVDDVAAQIRDALWKAKKEQAEKKLIDDLRARDVSELNEALINTIEIAAGDGAIVPRRRPGQVPPLQPTSRASGGAIPSPPGK
jgi:peptidyl-prolyl cis-trans isomerase C